MGILDDAIRQHLDLKRLHGAEDSEVKRLEDEAFGPPTRPGEPDFPESQEQAAVATEEKPDEATPDPGAEAETTLMGADAPAAAPAEPAAEPAPTSDQPEPTPEPPAIEQPVLGAEPAAPETRPEEPPATEAPSPPAEDADGGDTAFFDQAAGELDLDDLDLDLEDEEMAELVDEAELEAEAPGAAPAAPEPPPPAPDEHPVAGLETEEHPMEELLEDDAPAAPEPPAEAPATDEEALAPDKGDEPVPPAPEGEPESGEGDVLEETPEFLRDQPEDDDLWFEQGEPKDFDFD